VECKFGVKVESGKQVDEATSSEVGRKRSSQGLLDFGVHFFILPQFLLHTQQLNIIVRAHHARGNLMEATDCFARNDNEKKPDANRTLIHLRVNSTQLAACPVITVYPSYRRKPVSMKAGLDAGSCPA